MKRIMIGIMCLVLIFTSGFLYGNWLQVEGEDNTKNNSSLVKEEVKSGLQKVHRVNECSMNQYDMSDVQENYDDIIIEDVENIEEECEDINIDKVDENNENEQVGKTRFDDSEFSEYGGVTVDLEIVVNDTALPLFPTFVDSELAINVVSQNCDTVLDVLRNQYNLEPFSKENWRIYYDCMSSYYDEPNKKKWFKEENPKVAELELFFDIYENQSENAKLIEKAKNADTVKDLMCNYDFLTSLPSFDTEDLSESKTLQEFDKEINSDKQIEAISLAYNTNEFNPRVMLLSYSDSDAIKYAKKFAENRNRNFGYIENHDCTNFASQIMLAGGKNYTLSWITCATFGIWHYTDAWANANCFANYWGVDNTYATHKNFSKNLKKGDYITEDKANDGNWDHIGFVVDVADSYNQKLGYKNYKVAQHTNNYLAWASSDTCGWDKLKSNYPNCRFGIIRV